LLAKIDGIAQPGDWWVLAGSLPPGVEEDFYARIVRVLNRHQAKVVLDTTGDALRLGCAERPFLVKPNAEEAHALTGLPVGNVTEICRVAGEIRQMGAENVVISMGKAGALMHSAEGSWLVGTPKVEERNPIGAGDSMVGGLIWALTRGLDLKACLACGVACGAATASQGGTEVGSRELIERLISQVTFLPL